MRTPLRYLLGACLICSLIPILAHAAPPLHFGAKAGMAIASVDPDDSGTFGEFSNKLGPAGGGFITVGISDRFAIQGELLFVSKGLSFGENEATDEAGNPIGEFNTLLVTDWVEFPLMLRVDLPGRTGIRTTALLGAAVAVKVDERLVTTGSVETSQDTDGFSSNDVGLTGGIEVGMRLGAGWAFLETRYTYGLNDVAEDFINQEEKNRVLTVMLGFSL